MSDHSDAPTHRLTYRDAGVDIDAGNRLISLIKNAAASTRRPEVLSGLGGFGACFNFAAERYKDPVLVSATDGVGTKLKLAFLMDRHDTVGIDLVAMSVNDLIVQGAEPLFFLDYFATGKLHPEKAALVIEGIAQGCRQSGCALIGGETAEMPDFYSEGEYDLAGFAVGAVDRDKILTGETSQPGDILLGLASSGPHSNGYSLIRKLVLEHGPGLEHPFEKGTLGEALLAPTRIYVKPILQLIQSHTVRGIVHITGGGFQENIPRILPETTIARIDRTAWQWPAIFSYLQQLGNVEEMEMLRTFNCGIGMVVIVPADEAGAAKTLLQELGEQVTILGELLPRNNHKEQVLFS
ncbi:phosphoribosylformylglycinamidine cyclo-ligase [Magnetococcales bacterium HHB-1]